MHAMQTYPHFQRPDSVSHLVGARPPAAAAGAAAAAAGAAVAAAGGTAAEGGAADCEHLAPVLSLESVHTPDSASRLFDRLDRLLSTALERGSCSAVGRCRRRQTPQKVSAAAAASLSATATTAAAAAEAPEGSAVATSKSTAQEGDAFVLPLLVEPKVDGQSVALTYALVDTNCSSSNNSSSSNNNTSSISSGCVRYRLVRALTRGDGRCGECVTFKALQLGQAGMLPLTITLGNAAAAAATATAQQEDTVASGAAAGARCWPRQLEVRGEAFMSLSAFQRLNANRMRDGLKPLSSPRHAVVGLLRRLEGNADGNDANIRFCAYGLVAAPAGPTDTHQGSSNGAAAAAGAAAAGVSTQLCLLKRLQQWGFEVMLRHSRLVQGRRAALAAYEEQILYHTRYVARLEEALAARAAAATTAAEVSTAAAPLASLSLEDVPCDGVVYKLDSLQQQLLLGSTARSPRWAFALKFPSTAARTRLLGVTWTVGSSGVCTPVAVLEPVLLGGVTSSRASLHSLQEMRRKDVRVGDQVYVHLKGETVPQLAGVDLRARKEGTDPVMPPAQCPSCGRTLMEKPLPASKRKNSKEGKRGKGLRSSKGRKRNFRSQQQNEKEECVATTSGADDTAAADSTAAAGDTAAVTAAPAAAAHGALWCPGGWSCGAQRLQRLRRFFSRDGVAVTGLGPRALGTLTARGYVEAPIDVFFLREVDRRRVEGGGKGIEAWRGWGPQARDSLFKEIEIVQQRGVSLQHLLFALGIPGLGRRAAAELAQKTQNIEGFSKLLDQLADYNGLPRSRTPEQQQQQQVKIPGVDAALLQELRLFGTDPRNRKQLLDLANALPIHPVASGGGGSKP